MKILLITCPSTKKFLPIESLGIGYLASVLRIKDYHVDLIDTDLEYAFVPVDYQVEMILYIVKNGGYDLIGLSVNDESYESAVKITNMISELNSEKKIKILYGGYLATFAGSYLMDKHPSIDYVIKGEGEKTIVELVENLNDIMKLKSIKGLIYRCEHGIVENESQPLIKDLNSLPFPSRDHINHLKLSDYPVAISSSRGCEGNCIYCSISSFYKKSCGENWRSRSVENIIEEIKYLYNTFKSTSFIFVDDEFIGSNKVEESERLYDFVKKVSELDFKIQFKLFCRADHVSTFKLEMLKKIGLYIVFLGIESFCDDRLKSMGKQVTVKENFNAINILEELCINYSIGFIPIDIHSTLDSVELEYMQLLKINENDYFIGNPGITSRDIKMLPYFGSPYFNLLSKKDLLRGEFPKYDYKIPDKQVEKLHEFLSNVDNEWIEKSMAINKSEYSPIFSKIIFEISRKNSKKLRELEIHLVLELINAIRLDQESKLIDKIISKYKCDIMQIINQKNQACIELLGSVL